MLKVSWEDRDHNLWIELEGDLDQHDCMQIQDEFHERIQKGDGDVIIVMSGVTFLSSMGIGMLVKANQDLKGQERTLKLSGVPDKVKKVLEATHLLDEFSLV